MKRFSFLTSIAFLMLGIIAFASCKDDDKVIDEPCATWDADVQPIIAATCAYSGCHSGADAGMFVPAGAEDYTSYAGIKANLDNGKFNMRALVDKDMPPVAFVPAGSPTELTAAQLETLQCWVDGGYPES